jgi:hypothetical protein
MKKQIEALAFLQDEQGTVKQLKSGLQRKPDGHVANCNKVLEAKQEVP